MQASDTRYAPIRETFYVDVYTVDGMGAETYSHLTAEDAARLAAAAQANGMSVDVCTEGE